MGEALKDMPFLPALTGAPRLKRSVNFRKHRKINPAWRWLVASLIIGLPPVAGLAFVEARYLVHYWQARQAFKSHDMAQAEKAFQAAGRWWVPYRLAGHQAYTELFARHALYQSYLKVIDPYQQESNRLESQWMALRGDMMKGQVGDQDVLSRLEEIVRANHQLVEDLPQPEKLLHAKDVAVHQHWVTALKLREQSLTQLWYAFHLHDPRKVTVANDLMGQARDAQTQYEAGIKAISRELGGR